MTLPPDELAGGADGAGGAGGGGGGAGGGGGVLGAGLGVAVAVGLGVAVAVTVAMAVAVRVAVGCAWNATCCRGAPPRGQPTPPPPPPHNPAAPAPMPTTTRWRMSEPPVARSQRASAFDLSDRHPSRSFIISAHILPAAAPRTHAPMTRNIFPVRKRFSRAAVTVRRCVAHHPDHPHPPRQARTGAAQGASC